MEMVGRAGEWTERAEYFYVKNGSLLYPSLSVAHPTSMIPDGTLRPIKFAKIL